MNGQSFKESGYLIPKFLHMICQICHTSVVDNITFVNGIVLGICMLEIFCASSIFYRFPNIWGFLHTIPVLPFKPELDLCTAINISIFLTAVSLQYLPTPLPPILACIWTHAYTLWDISHSGGDNEWTFFLLKQQGL